jgi:hypothetical protein
MLVAGRCGYISSRPHAPETEKETAVSCLLQQIGKVDSPAKLDKV